MKYSILFLIALCATYSNTLVSSTTTTTVTTGTTGATHGATTSQAATAEAQTPNTSTVTASPGTSSSPSPTEQAPSAGSVQAEPAASPKKDEIKSALLKNYAGVKVTGPCDSDVGLYLIPYIYISVMPKDDIIQLSTSFPDSDNTIVEFKNGNDSSTNKCQGSTTKTFKLILHLEDNILTLKWVVYDQGNGTDVKKYRLPKLERPITSIQVHSVIVQGDKVFYKSKDYSINKEIPEKCEQIASSCFLSGNTDIESCYTCNLLINNDNVNDECFNYVSKAFKEDFLTIKTKGEDDEDSSEHKLVQSIDSILDVVYKTNEKGDKELITLEELDLSLKDELKNYCQLLKEVDTSGTLEVHQMGSETDVLKNITKILQKHKDEKKISLHLKLQNPAICIKNVDEWMVHKKGLTLPILQNGHGDDYSGEQSNVGDKQNDKGYTFQEDKDGIIDLSVIGKNSNASSTPFTNHMFCNTEYCDRSKDKSSCLSKIEAEEQGTCATSWIFASKLHLESIKCMKGYDYVPSSALYVANCSQKEGDAKCHAASNPLEFLNIIDSKQFLPSASDMPYSYKLVGDVCPKPKHHWTNLWNNIKLLNHKNVPNSVGTKGYTAYQSEHFKNNMDEFIKIVKSEVMKKGSVIAYVKVDEMMGYDMNGKAVHGICGGEVPDLAVNIIGYGNYINAEGVKKSYWLLRNSWGKYWGDNGNFKVDMHTPEHCQYNFIHTAAVFNLDIPHFESASKKNTEMYSYYLSSSPDFYDNLYYNAVDGVKGNATKNGKHLPGGYTVSGQDSTSNGADATTVVQGSETTVQAESTRETGETGNPGSSGVAGPAAPVTVTPAVEEPSQEQVSTPSNVEDSKKTHVIHILKHIKETKMTTRVVTYNGEYELGDHACSRTQAQSWEKQEECLKFCNDNLPECPRNVSVGYCLTKLRKSNDCIFCFV
ncbi:serine-repeat antigen 5 [Plasmodium gonderi]|uniref:Serine-repeat antigen 5 n=1 Tax=Plasmodium gonderi TaxID=77519 RepID=A0A1Y1JE99_PLAGO|nr:serine-repeat antigen 5 [Plasmodium gonderi]GAW79537.1 serine-repeat antigen 5 [Plasmodium gonderi]